MTVTLNDQDITQYIQGNSFVLTKAKSEFGQVLLNPIPSLVGIDVDGFWNTNNPASVFFGLNDLSVFEIKVFEGSLEIFNGFIQDIKRTPNGTANVDLQTELQLALDQNFKYSSGSGLNPAEIFIGICQQYKINYDPVSTLRSSAVYELDEIVVSADVLDPNIKILSFFEALAQVGIASIYSIGNYLYYQVYEYGSITNTLATLENTQDTGEFYMLSKPQIDSVHKEIPEGYSVTFKSNVLPSGSDLTATFGLQTNAFQVSGGGGDLITIDSLQSAVWIGEQWIEYLARADTEINMGIKTQFARDLEIGYPLRLIMNDGTIPMNFIVNQLITQNSVLTNMRGVAYGN